MELDWEAKAGLVGPTDRLEGQRRSNHDLRTYYRPVWNELVASLQVLLGMVTHHPCLPALPLPVWILFKG